MLAVVLAAGVAMAGSDLSWNACVAAGTGAQDRTVACTNAGSGILYLTIDPDVDYPSVGAVDNLIDVVPASNASTFPLVQGTSWWYPAVLGNRFGAGAASDPSGACPEWYLNAPDPGIVLGPSAFAVLNPGQTGQKLRLEFETVVAQGEEQPVSLGVDNFVGSLSLKFNAGTNTSLECQAGGAIGVYDVNIQVPPASNNHQGQTPKVRNCATFRNPAATPCPGATPTKKASWGSIKALYR
jgi:hypothetical protein